MAQNITQLSATGSYSDASKQDVTTAVAWTVSDASIATIGAATGQVTIQNAGKIWGGTIGITATLAPGTPGTASIIVVASDSGSVAPRMPQSDDQWRVLGLSPWGTWFGMQEPSGSAPVGSGSFPFTLEVDDGNSGAVVYRQATAGWTRGAMATPGGSTAQRIVAPSGTGPAFGQGYSLAMLGYIQLFPSPGSLPLFGGLGNSTAMISAFYTANLNQGDLMLRGSTGAQGRIMTGPSNLNHGDRVHPFLIVYHSGTNRLWGFTDDVISVTGNMNYTTADDFKGFGARPTTACPSASISYMAFATGSIVDSLASVSGAADFLSRLGWNVAWKDCPTESGTIKLPFLAEHWKSLGLTPWTATWNLQETIGTVYSFNEWDGYDTKGWATNLNNVNSYNYALPGWKRTSIQYLRTANRRLVVSPDYANDPNMMFNPTGSFATMCYSMIGSQGNDGIVGIMASAVGSKAASCHAGIGGSGLTIVCAGEAATGSITTYAGDGAVHPFLLVYDKTSSRVKLYTDLECITGTFNATTRVDNTTGSLVLGSNGTAVYGNAASASHVYWTFCTGALAESLSDNGRASAFLKTLGWNVSW